MEVRVCHISRTQVNCQPQGSCRAPLQPSLQRWSSPRRAHFFFKVLSCDAYLQFAGCTPASSSACFLPFALACASCVQVWALPKLSRQGFGTSPLQLGRRVCPVFSSWQYGGSVLLLRQPAQPNLPKAQSTFQTFLTQMSQGPTHLLLGAVLFCFGSLRF